MTIDWGVGRYEVTAAQLLPAAGEAVAVAAPQPGERVVDVGCGTGNAALLAAATGARVTGVDPATRLLEVARQRAADDGLDVEFLPGDAAALPLPDASADLILSVFGVIFAPDPAAAIAEMARVLAPAGRIVITSWLPGGAVGRIASTAQAAVRDALGLPASTPGLAWHNPDQVAGVAAAYGLRVSAVERTIAFTAGSPEEFVDTDRENHPMAISGAAVLDARGESDALRQRLIDIAIEDNEDPSAFRATSRYVILTLSR